MMCNHFHLLLEVPPAAEGGISDEELPLRLSAIYYEEGGWNCDEVMRRWMMNMEAVEETWETMGRASSGSLAGHAHRRTRSAAPWAWGTMRRDSRGSFVRGGS
jgi:hypothetical protein